MSSKQVSTKQALAEAGKTAANAVLSSVVSSATGVGSRVAEHATRIGVGATERLVVSAMSSVPIIGKAMADALDKLLQNVDLEDRSAAIVSCWVTCLNKIAGGAERSSGLNLYQRRLGSCECACAPCTCGKAGGSDEAVLTKFDMDQISRYSESANSSLKRRLIHELIEVAAKFGYKAEGSTDLERIRSFAAQLPQKISPDNAKQAQICDFVADQINRVFNEKIIAKGDPKLTCQQVSEFLISLSASTHIEFLVMRKNISKILRNLRVLENTMEEYFGQLRAKIAASEDPELPTMTGPLMELHDLMMGEIKRQTEMLKNILDVEIAPVDQTLSSLVKDMTSTHGKLEKLKTHDPETNFGRIIQEVLAMTGHSATLMALVEGALSRVGMTVAEYVGEPNLSALENRLADLLRKAKLSDDEMYEFVRARDILVKNFNRKQDIAAMKSGSGVNVYEIGGVIGGDEFKKTPMEKRIEVRKKLRNLIFKQFIRRMNELVSELAGCVDVISKKVGTEIPLSEQLESFRNVMWKLSTLTVGKQKASHYLAFTGYYNDALSRSLREEFLQGIKTVLGYLESLMEMSMYSGCAHYFRDLHSKLAAIVKLIEDTGNEVEAKFGRGEDAADRAEGKAIRGGDCMGNIYGGEAIGAIQGGAIERLPHDPNAAMNRGDPLHGEDMDPREFMSYAALKFDSSKGRTFEQAVQKFDYNVRASQIRKNLAFANKDLTEYSKNYEKLLSESLGQKLLDKQKIYNAQRETLKDALKVAATDPEKLAINDAIKFLDMQWASTKKFWATVEALDRYMQAFTNGMLSNPADVKDIQAQLADVEVIAKWYDENTGDNLVRAFDCLGHGGIDINFGGQHYYHRLHDLYTILTHETVVAAGSRAALRATIEARAVGDEAQRPYAVELIAKLDAMPADNTIAQDRAALIEFARPFNPQRMAPLADISRSRVHIGKVFANLAALKNLISVFSHMGSKFGGEEIRKKVFLTPSQIYVNLIDYMQTCAFVQNGMEGRFKQITGTVAAGESEEDRYFVMIIKAMAAKIFTVTGLYDVLDRPHEINSISPIRMILGGAAEMPKVDEKVLELYMRLPLLLQFYRHIFGYDEEFGDYDSHNDYQSYNEFRVRGNDHMKISLVPDVDGVFSGLISLIFRKAKFIKNNMFSDDDICEIIRECNLIYQKLADKYREDAVRGIISELVNEINRRYGIITQNARAEWEQNFGYRYDYADKAAAFDQSVEIARGEIPLLPGEQDDETQMLSAGEKYLQAASSVNDVDPDRPRRIPSGWITEQHMTLIRRFRCAIDRYFEHPDERYSFVEAIRSVRNKLRAESNDGERLNMVSGLIRGVDVYSRIDYAKYLLFHETVVAGLNTLSAIHTIVGKFVETAVKHDLSGFLRIAAKAPTAMPLNVIIDHLTRVARVNNPNSVTMPGAGQVVIMAAAGAAPSASETLPPAKFAAYIVDNEDDADSEAYCRKLFNHQNVMRNILSNLFGFAGDLTGLVKFDINNGDVSVNWSGLKTLIESLFASVTYFINLLRPNLSEKFMGRFIDKLVPGSLYWLQEQLLDKRIIGREKSVYGTGHPYYTVDDAIMMQSRAFRILTRKYKHTAANGNLADAANPLAPYDSFVDVFERVLFKEPVIDAEPTVADFLGNTIECAHFVGTPDKLMLDTRFIARFDNLYHYGIQDKSSLLYVFNGLLANYMNAFFDGGSKKVFSNVVSQIANHFSRALADLTETYPDTVPVLAMGSETPVAVKIAAVDVLRKYLNNAGRAASARLLANVLVGYLQPAFNAARLNPAENAAVGAELTNQAALGLDATYDALFAAGGVLENSAANMLSLENHLTQFPFITYSLARDSINKRMELLANYLVAMHAEVGAPREQQKIIDAMAASKSTVNMPNERGQSTYLLAFDEALSVARQVSDGATSAIGTGAYLAYADDTNGSAFGHRNLGMGMDWPGARFRNFNGQIMCDPNPANIIFTSLAALLKNITSVKSTTGVSHYMFDSVADVPQSMKEKMRANMPHFKQLFAKLAAKCDFYRKILYRSPVNCALSGRVLPCQNPFPGKLMDPLPASDERKQRFMSLCETIGKSCNVVMSACDQVLREIGDMPSPALEIYSGSMRDYEAQYGAKPFTPSSTLLKFVTAPDMQLLPIGVLGSTGFKFAFGTRHILAGEAGADSLVGFSDIVSKYNSGTEARFGADSAKSAGFASAYLTAIKFINSVVKVAHVVDLQSPLVAGMSFYVHDDAQIQAIANRGLASITRGKVPLGENLESMPAVFAFGKSDEVILNAFDSSMRDDRIKDIVDSLIERSARPPVNSLEIQNIIDLNIIPINVHALMREIPLANLYNYAYTYDRLVVESFYGLKDARALGKIQALCGNAPGRVDNSKDLLVSILINPYADLSEFLAANSSPHVRQIFSGTFPSGLGRPKFLSDQIWNKVLLGRLLPVPAYPDRDARGNYANVEAIPNVDRAAYPYSTAFPRETNLTFIEKNERVNGYTPSSENKFEPIVQLQQAQFGWDLSTAALNRFNSTLIRQLIFIVNVYRTIRMKLHRDLTYSKEVIRSAESITDWNLTEFRGINTVDDPYDVAAPSRTDMDTVY